MRAELTQNRIRVDKATGLHVLFRIPQGLMQGGTVFLVEPISGIERQQLDFCSFGQVGGFVNDQPAGLHSSLQCHSDHSSTAKRRTTSWLRVASSSLVFAMSAMAGEGRGLTQANRYPGATRVMESSKSFIK